MNENYATAKTLATINHFGEEFRIVRRRYNGKPWRKYLALVHGATSIATFGSITDPKEAELYAIDKLRKGFESRQALLAKLNLILKAYRSEGTP